MIYTRPDWANIASAQYFKPEIDNTEVMDTPQDGWWFMTPDHWKPGEIRTAPEGSVFRVYEHAYSAVENLSPYHERVEMIWLARIRLLADVVRPAKRDCPHRAFDGTGAVCLWSVDPTATFHQWAALYIQDILYEFRATSDFLEEKNRFVRGEIDWKALDIAEHKLRRVVAAMNSDGRLAMDNVHLSLYLEDKDLCAEAERKLNQMLLALKPADALE